MNWMISWLCVVLGVILSMILESIYPMYNINVVILQSLH